jgi:hypothetical protein
MHAQQGELAVEGAPRRRRRVFLWVFMAVQVLFVLWIVTGATAGSSPCRGLSAHDCATASDAGHGLAIAAQVVAWVVADFLLAVIYGIYRLARRPAAR